MCSRLIVELPLCGNGLQLLIPHHRSSESETQAMLSDMRAYLIHLFHSPTAGYYHSPPSVITIARSAVDQFTPSDQVDALLAAVLNMIETDLIPLWSHSTCTLSVLLLDTPASDRPADITSSGSSSELNTHNTHNKTDNTSIEECVYSIRVHDLCVDDVAAEAYGLFLHPLARKMVVTTGESGEKK